MTLSPWQHQGRDFAPTPEDLAQHVGFVYLITEVSSGRRYVGIKGFWSFRKAEAKKKRRVKSESDWQKYCTSSATLKAKMRAAPADYKREILHLCSSKGEMSYLESKELFARAALESDEYFNDNIAGRYYRKNVARYFK